MTAAAVGPDARPAPPGRHGAGIRIERVSHWFGAGERNGLVLADVDLTIAPGEFVCLVGPSGCGKSTLLNLIAGFERPRLGRVLMDGDPVTGPSPARGMVFQQARLFSWLKVRGNVAFGPTVARSGRAEIDRITTENLSLVGLLDAADKWPHELSGGMQQRVAIARTLATRPRVLLLDEPFAALDALTRERLQDETLAIWRRTGMTVVFVTHSVDEAAYLGTRVVALDRDPGRVALDRPWGLGAQLQRDGLRSTAAFLRVRDDLHQVVVRAAGG